MDRREFLQGMGATFVLAPASRSWLRWVQLTELPSFFDYAFSAPEDKSTERQLDPYPLYLRNRPKTCQIRLSPQVLDGFMKYLKGAPLKTEDGEAANCESGGTRPDA